MEAALVFPLVIVIAVTMLYMMVGLYEEAESSAENQVQIMSDVVNQKYDAVILQCSD